MHPTSRIFAVSAAAIALMTAPQRQPADVARELLTADRAFATASADVDVVTGLSLAFGRNIAIPDRASSSFARGRLAAVAALERDTTNLSSRLTWSPIRAGVSADGMHGFTYGYTTRRIDAPREVRRLLGT
jgi:hypothetical protein